MTVVLNHQRGNLVSEQSTVMCAAGGRPHQITDRDGRPMSGFLCERHLDTLSKLLHDVEREVSDLSAVPSMQINYGTAGGSSGSGKPARERANLRLDVVMLRDSRTSTSGERLPGPACYHCNHDGCRVRRSADEERDSGSTKALNPLTVLNDYAERVRDERNLTPPVRLHRYRNPYLSGPSHDHDCGHDSCTDLWITGVTPEPPTIRSERQVLSRNLEWIAQRDWVRDMYKQLRELLVALQRVNGTSPPSAEGRCPVPLAEGECGGPLFPAKPTHSTGQWSGAAHDAVSCSQCGARWEGPGPLARLALMVEASKKAGSR